MEVILNRRSYRKFLDKEVGGDKIEKLLRAGMQAPSACDGRPWEFIVVRNSEILDKLSSATTYAMCVKNSRCAIIPCYRNSELKNKDYVICDMSACVENILIEANYLKLGAVWIGVAPVSERINNVKSILNIKDRLVPFCIIPIGYPVNIKEYDDRFDKERIYYIN